MGQPAAAPEWGEQTLIHPNLPGAITPGNAAESPRLPRAAVPPILRSAKHFGAAERMQREPDIRR